MKSAEWEMKKHYIQMQIEIDAYKNEISAHYAEEARRNTKVETNVIERKEEFKGTSSRFTWVEGYFERDVYAPAALL